MPDPKPSPFPSMPDPNLCIPSQSQTSSLHPITRPQSILFFPSVSDPNLKPDLIPCPILRTVTRPKTCTPPHPTRHSLHPVTRAQSLPSSPQSRPPILALLPLSPKPHSLHPVMRLKSPSLVPWCRSLPLSLRAPNPTPAPLADPIPRPCSSNPTPPLPPPTLGAALTPALATGDDAVTGAQPIVSGPNPEVSCELAP